MEWGPNKEGVNELITLFKQSKGSNNEKHREIFEKINQYAKNKEFTNYLIYILNDRNVEEDIRQISALTLKGIMERQFNELEEEELNYFKQKILKSYLDKKPSIRKAISNLVNTYLRNGGLESWPEILEILYQSLDNEVGVDMSLETLIIIVEDSGNLIEEKYQQFLSKLTSKLTNYLEFIAINDPNSTLVILTLTALHIILENCSFSMTDILENISKSLLPMGKSKNFSIRYRLGRCWLVIVRMKKDILLTFGDSLFNFFYENLVVEYYEMNFTASEFYLFVIEELEKRKSNLPNKEQIFNSLRSGIKILIPLFFRYARLTSNDICGEEVENKQFTNSTKSKSENGRSIVETIDEENYDEDKNKFEEEIEEEEIETYTTNWTLRKCSSKLLDKFSKFFPEEVIENLVPFMEKGIQQKDWVVKERAILTLGAIGKGSYELLKPNLNNLLRYLSCELNHTNKLIRAISCWTISRFSNFILTDNKSEAEDLVRLCLSEILKKFLDKDPIVQEAACTAFNEFIYTHKEKLSPYILDIIKIFTSAFENYKKSSLLILYESIEILTENYSEEFRKAELVQELLIVILQRWFDIINSANSKGTIKDSIWDSENIAFLDLIASIIKVSGSLVSHYFDNFMNGTLLLIGEFGDDKDIICKSLDIIAVICQALPQQVKDSPNKFKIIQIIFDLLKGNADPGIKQYILALIGDICRVDTSLLVNNVDILARVLVESVYIRDRTDLIQVSVCNNSCWTLGILAKTFPDKIKVYADEIMNKIVFLFSSSKLNKSLAQNASICIGRIGLINPEVVSKYLESFLKQFCLSVKIIEESEEKQDAFSGLCNAILHNPTGILTHFAFFCDALSQYANSPAELEQMFQNIILSYKNMLKDNWGKFFNVFPEKLKTKMKSRFVFLQ